VIFIASKQYDILNEERYNNFGSKRKIIKCRGHTDIDVYFEEYDYVVTNKRYERFKNGAIECPYEPRHCGIGYMGVGKYSTKTHRDIYNHWLKILQRCHDKKFKEKHPTYENCVVCKEWLNFQDFAKWYEENYYKCNNEQMEIDKDILFKSNKIYSPQTCMIVPKRINDLILNCKKARGKYPIGVTLKNNKFYVRCSTLDENDNIKRVSLGYYNTIEEAFEVYKNFKENYIKQVADKYREIIPQKLYNALYEYKININD
jgi:hypothetical protein